MNPLFDNFPLHRVVLSFNQKDYRKKIHVLYGSPGLNRKDWLGLAGHEKMVPLGGKAVLNLDSKVEEKIDENVLRQWKGLDDLMKLVEHPHTEKAKEEKSSKNDGVYYKDGRRYHALHPGPVNLSNWAVLISRRTDSGEYPEVEEYTVINTRLAPKA